MGLRAFGVNIIGLSNKIHHFHYEFGDDFFAHYGTGLVSEGSFNADVSIDKHETFINAAFRIRGTAKLICDRSLDPFDFPIDVERKIVFKFGESNEELTEEIVMIERDTDTLELGQYLYEFIGLQIPIKKLHPRYHSEPDLDGAEGKVIYSSGADRTFDADSGEEDIDPIWEKLKKLK